MNSSLLLAEVLALAVIVMMAVAPALCRRLWHKER
jgi:leucyl-tRNA synthetase